MDASRFWSYDVDPKFGRAGREGKDDGVPGYAMRSHFKLECFELKSMIVMTLMISLRKRVYFSDGDMAAS